MDIKGKYVIIRHSTRDSIRNVTSSNNMPLTPEGIELAKHLGVLFSNHADSFIFFHSSVFRCEQTATFMKESIEAKGKEVKEVKKFKPLGGFFNINKEACREIRNRNKYEFTKNWSENRISPDIIMPIEKAGHFMLSEILKKEDKEVTKVFVTHDWNIFCLKSIFFKTNEDLGIPKFLEGIVFSRDLKDYWLLEEKYFKHTY